MILRPARADEVGLVREIERRAAALFAATAHADLAAPDDEELLPAAELASAVAKGQLLVAEAEIDNRPVGFAMLGMLGEDAHLRELDVLPENAGQGIGSALLQACIDLAGERSAPRLVLTTFIDVPFNAPFYARRGFQMLAPEDLTPALGAILAQEADAGLPAAARCAMALMLNPGS